MNKEVLDYKRIGERIKQVRKKRRLTQEKVAEQLGVSTVYYSRIERGSSKLSLVRLVQISEILGVEISEFISGSKYKEENYLDRDMDNILSTCTPKKQKLIYNVAKIIAGIDFDKN